ncbi:MAG: hypothetical protein LW842_09735 [Sphingobacteriales bacterium]|nr:hypothetical protein [Sphingobacteriales bacterium]
MPFGVVVFGFFFPLSLLQADSEEYSTVVIAEPLSAQVGSFFFPLTVLQSPRTSMKCQTAKV